MVKVPSGHLFGLELFGAGAVGEVGDGAAQVEQIAAAGLFDDRHDEPPVERHGNADVDVVVVDNVIANQGGVDHRNRLQRIRDGLDDEGQIGELSTRLFILGSFGIANLRDAGKVDFEDRVHVRRDAAAQHHVLGDLLPHHRHLLDAVALVQNFRRPCPPCLSVPPFLPFLPQILEDVVLGHAARHPTPMDLRDIHVVFLGDFPHEGGRPFAHQVPS